MSFWGSQCYVWIFVGWGSCTPDPCAVLLIKSKRTCGFPGQIPKPGGLGSAGCGGGTLAPAALGLVSGADWGSSGFLWMHWALSADPGGFVFLADRKFIEARRRALRRFINLVARHPRFSEDVSLRLFLSFSGPVSIAQGALAPCVSACIPDLLLCPWSPLVPFPCSGCPD